MANRRQHTIAQFYLRPFLSPGWVYRQRSSAPRATRNAAGVAVQQDYYGKDVAGRKTLDALNSYIENNAAPSFTKLVSNPDTITGYDWVVLSFLFANFAVRNPSYIEEWRATILNATAQLNVMAEKMTQRVIEASLAGSNLSEFRSEIDNESPTFTLEQLNKYATRVRKKGGHILAAGDQYNALSDIAQCIQRMTFLILEAPSDLFFVTSDRPLSLQRRINGSRVGAGWANSDALGSIALSPSRFLLMFHHKHSGVWQFKAVPEQVAGLNVKVIRFAHEEIYSPRKYREADDWMKSLGRWSSEQ
ncbi:MAG: DUF4238 domain-containing protein [Chloroflexi bacterium]|nr:DUF4238 domain-containing protein [Chloroflexota bacterium]